MSCSFRPPSLSPRHTSGLECLLHLHSLFWMPLLLESHPDLSGRGKHSLLWGPVALSVLPFRPKPSLTQNTHWPLSHRHSQVPTPRKCLQGPSPKIPAGTETHRPILDLAEQAVYCMTTKDPALGPKDPSLLLLAVWPWATSAASLNFFIPRPCLACFPGLFGRSNE